MIAFHINVVRSKKGIINIYVVKRKGEMGSNHKDTKKRESLILAQIECVLKT